MIWKGFFWQFLWGHASDSQRHYTPKSWLSIFQPRELGGLGIRRLFDVSRALIAKLRWMIYTKPVDFWV